MMIEIRRIFRKISFPSFMICFVPKYPQMNIPIPNARARETIYCPCTMIAMKLPINQKTDIAAESHFAIRAGSLMRNVLIK